MWKKYLSKKRIRKDQESLIHSLEGIGDILVFETGQLTKNKLIVKGLDQIHDVIKKYLNIRKSNPERFDKLSFKPEYFEVLSENELDANLRLSFNPKEYLPVFMTSINQIQRIHKAAVSSKNEEISRQAAHQLNWILFALSSKPDSGLFVEQILNYLTDLSFTAIRENDCSVYSSTLDWYISAVFDDFRKDKFDLNYIDIFDKYFWQSMRRVVSGNHFEIFRAFIRSVFHSIHVPDYKGSAVWDYGHLMLRTDLQKCKKLDESARIDTKVKELADSIDSISTKEELEEWQGRFNLLVKLVTDNLDGAQLEEAEKLKKEIFQHAITRYKFNNLLELIFAICSYCLFKNKVGYIRYLWDFKQPSDSEATWVGHDIVPSDPNDLIRFYFRKGLHHRCRDFFDDHHGSRIYYQRYFILLLARTLRPGQVVEADGIIDLKKFELPDLDVHRMSDIKNSVESLQATATDLWKNPELLVELGFSVDEQETLLKDKLMPFLEELKVSAEKRLSEINRLGKISPEKVEKFKRLVHESYEETAVLRKIFKELNSFEDKKEQKYEGPIKSYGVNILENKAAFFDEWYVHYFNWGHNYGKGIGSDENALIYASIAEKCESVQTVKIEDILNRFDDPSKIIIFSSAFQLCRIDKLPFKFTPKWQLDSKHTEKQGLEGLLSYKNYQIPVFGAYWRVRDRQILVVNKDFLGKLVQYNPLGEEDDKSNLSGQFYIEVKPLTEEHMKKLLEEPPAWLEKKGTPEQRKEELERLVNIKIYERFEFVPDPDFQGYRFTWPELD